jgi:hypothetical protein
MLSRTAKPMGARRPGRIFEINRTMVTVTVAAGIIAGVLVGTAIVANPFGNHRAAAGGPPPPGSLHARNHTPPEAKAPAIGPAAIGHHRRHTTRRNPHSQRKHASATPLHGCSHPAADVGCAPPPSSCANSELGCLQPRPSNPGPQPAEPTTTTPTGSDTPAPATTPDAGATGATGPTDTNGPTGPTGP